MQCCNDSPSLLVQITIIGKVERWKKGRIHIVIFILVRLIKPITLSSQSTN